MSQAQVQCPKCGNYRTVPYSRDPFSWEPVLADLLKILGVSPGYAFDNPSVVAKFKAGWIRARCDFCGLIFDANIVMPQSAQQTMPGEHVASPEEERLAKLEQLRAKGLVTEEEYARKRQEIISKL